MARVRSLIHLVAQRDALCRLFAQDIAYEPLLQCWKQALKPAEREALQSYDNLLKHYITTAPRPEKPQTAVH